MLDEQSGELQSGSRKAGEYGRLGGLGKFSEWEEGPMPGIEGDSGGASRFFYTAKASRGEREMGLEKTPLSSRRTMGEFSENDAGLASKVRNIHPTVKPLDLMRYLIRLVTPPGGLVLDPFLGSGTTLLACRLENFDGLGIEKEAEYEPIIRGRLGWVPPPLESFEEGDP